MSSMSSSSSSSSSSSTRTVSGSMAGVFGTFNPHKLPVALILLDGSWSGDMWHNAAATIVGQYQESVSVECFPVTVIGMLSLFPKSKGVWEDAVSFTQGKKTFAYFRNIGVPVLAARINRYEKRLTDSFGFMSDAYIGAIVNVFGSTHSQTFESVWSETPETELARLYEVPAWAKAIEFGGAGMSDAAIAKSRSLNGNAKSGTAAHSSVPQLNNWIATTILMQYLNQKETHATRIRLVQEKLGGRDDPKSTTWAEQAAALAKGLQDDIEANLEKGSGILLFNYRIGDVNLQHNANITLLQQVKTIASAHNLFVIPVMVSVKDPDEIQQIVDATKPFKPIELYAAKVMYDKRYTVAFWTMVAENMSDTVFGLVGGRSGSMDIASFVGVNCASWDEPLFDPAFLKEYQAQGTYLSSQAPQYLRLLSQRAVTSLIHLDGSSYVKGSGTKQDPNIYSKLVEADLKGWLDRGPKSPSLNPDVVSYVPKLDASQRATINSQKEYQRAWEKALGQLESAPFNICAWALRGTPLGRALLPSKKGKGDK